MNIKRAKEEIKNTVLAYLDKNDFDEYIIPEVRQRPILLMGPPGIGKTQIMQQIASECEIGLIAYTITHHTRQSAVGLPFIKEKNYLGKDYTVTEYTMSEIIASIYEYMEETGKREGILFIDEINCVSETLAPTILQFLQCKTFGNQSVPRGWIIAAAGNPPEYNKSVRDFDFVTLDRVRRMDIEADLTVFREYARAQHLHPFILSYLELRPQNFYKTQKDVDGLFFVTARGWEDLSYLISSYEKLDIPIDEDVIGQYLQHPDVAKDVAAYYDLYQKYRDEYDIRSILEGKAAAGIFRRLMTASFDEKLSCVELLVSGLHVRAKEAMDTDRLTNDCYLFLKDYKKRLSSGARSDHPDGLLTEDGLWGKMVHERDLALSREEKTGLLSPSEKNHGLKLQKTLTSWSPDPSLDFKNAFGFVKSGFDDLQELRTKNIISCADSLDHAFRFMEDAFSQGQEMVIFVTELTMDPFISSFIRENGCEPYYKYNKSLLLGNKRAEILAQISRDEIYSNANAYDF